MTVHCCEMMRSNAENVCEVHPDRYECPDCLIDYWPKSQSYGTMVHDGGNSMITISFCPWCGKSLQTASEQ